MVTIEKVIRSGKNIKLILDNNTEIVFKERGAEKDDLHEGMSFDEEDLKRIILLRQYPDALNHAVFMLSRRPCSRAEIRRSLQRKQYHEETVGLVLYKLEKENLVNDEEFSRAWVRYRSGGGYGSRRIYQELRQKGVDEDTAKQATAAIEPGDAYQSAFELAQKAMKRVKPGEGFIKVRNRIVSGLIRKGYDWETASKAFDSAFHLQED